MIAMPKQKDHQKTNFLPRLLIVVGVLFLAAMVLALKEINREHVQEAGSTGIVPLQGADAMGETLAPPSELPADQLRNALAEHRPTLAFFHSNSCRQCVMMIENVNRVYPEFFASVVLVDVYVYDEKNEPLLKMVGLQYIPTMIFYDRSGREQVFVGLMDEEQLRQSLAALAEVD
jgi:thiol:disulfide interchange protein